MNAYDIVDDLLKTYIKHCKVPDSAYQTIKDFMPPEYMPQDSFIEPERPEYFKLASVQKVLSATNKEIHLDMSIDLPVANTGDGVAVNTKASRLMSELYGMMSPGYRCAVHAADGTLKRICKYKTMSVKEIADIYECIRSITKVCY